MNKETMIGHVKSRDGQRVNVVEVEGMVGYRFDAVDKESLPFAVELACKQTAYIRANGVPELFDTLLACQVPPIH